MAGDWIKMRTNLDTDPAVVRISSVLKTDRFAIVGRLHKIWSWADDHLTDGQNVPIESAFLDQLVELPGFADAMRSVGWLSGRDGNLCFPSFSRHNGASAKARALDAERKRSARKTSEKCPDNNRTELGPEREREKRREELTLSHTPEAKKTSSEIPKGTHLEDPEFAELWDQWGRHLLELGKALTPTASEAQVYKLAGLSVDEAKSIVRFSIERQARNLITNGDHRGPPSAGDRQKQYRRKVPSFEEGLIK